MVAIPTMEEEDVDVVCGSRFLTDDHRYPAPISRRTGIHIFAFLLSRIVGTRVSDPTSGFRLYNRRAMVHYYNRDYVKAVRDHTAALKCESSRARRKNAVMISFQSQCGRRRRH